MKSREAIKGPLREQKELLETVLNSQRNISIGFVMDGGNRKDLTVNGCLGKGW